MSADPILFLDFDGVLHPNMCTPTEWFCRLPLLEQALAGSNLMIVISSSWRFHHEYPSLVRRFPAALRSLVGGTTGDAYVGRQARFHEIRHWIDRHAPGLPAHRWCALDDDTFGFPRDCASLLPCDGAVGLQEEEVECLRAWVAGLQ